MMVHIVRGDITRLHVDVVVNAANSSLMGGGGVDGAIHKAGGSQILEECKAIRNTSGICPAGEARITSAGQLPARWVIHTVGPIWNGGDTNEKELLEHCYHNALKLAESLSAKSIAFPNISTGVYHFPKELAAEIALGILLAHTKSSITDIYCCCFDNKNYQLYRNTLDKIEKINHAVS